VNVTIGADIVALLLGCLAAVVALAVGLTHLYDVTHGPR
jgi:hypothetical protein